MPRRRTFERQDVLVNVGELLAQPLGRLLPFCAGRRGVRNQCQLAGVALVNRSARERARPRARQREERQRRER